MLFVVVLPSSISVAVVAWLDVDAEVVVTVASVVVSIASVLIHLGGMVGHPAGRHQSSQGVGPDCTGIFGGRGAGPVGGG